MTKIALMLGGNLPGTPAAMSEAVEKLRLAGVREIVCSDKFSSAPVDCVPGTPDFLDMALTGYWNDSPEKLLLLCQKLEIEAGRPAVHSSRESRILDCDIILFGDLVLQSEFLTIPHPRARERQFVLEPLAQIAPQMLFPDGMSVKEAWQKLESK